MNLEVDRRTELRIVWRQSFVYTLDLSVVRFEDWVLKQEAK